MSEKQLEKISEELGAIKNLLVLLLQQNKIQGGSIAKALGISQGRLSQIFSQKKCKKQLNN